MKRILMTILLLNVAAGACAGTVGANLIGHWKVTGVVGAQETTSLSSDQADALAGKELIVAADSIQFDGDACAQPALKASSHNRDQFFWKEYKLDPRELPLPSTVTEFKTNCANLSSINFIYVRDRRQIVFFWKGFFLNAVKQT
jgi:hypothetical protein